jgi:FixJ family two-component response regulator
MPIQRKIVGVVDNDASILAALTDLLEVYGFAVVSFTSAEEFLSSEVQKRIDCLLLDIHLDGLSGIELRHRLKTSRPELQVIFMSALDDERSRRRAVEAGCVTFLRKPFQAIELIDAIKKVVAERK